MSWLSYHFGAQMDVQAGISYGRLSLWSRVEEILVRLEITLDSSGIFSYVADIMY